MMAGPADQSRPSQDYKLAKETELRVDVGADQSCELLILDGTAEIFGTELAQKHPYTFVGRKFAVFTWHGCKVQLSGSWTHAYSSDETPMLQYLNTHSALEEARRQADSDPMRDGPRVVICGPIDSGKSTLSKVLLGYATRMGRKPIFVDLDLGQGAITVPGTMAALQLDRPVDPEIELSLTVPIVYWFGHPSPSENPALFKTLTDNLRDVVERRIAAEPSARLAGLIINTMGWVDGLGKDLLMHVIESLRADVVLVLNSDRLYADLQQDYSRPGPDQIRRQIVKLQRSGGVVERPKELRTHARMQKIGEYFYGLGKQFSPAQLVVNFDDIAVYRFGGGAIAPSTALPVGQVSKIDPTRAVAELPTMSLKHTLLAVSHAQTPDEVAGANIAGFVHVVDVDMQKRQLTLLAPTPGPLPGRFLLNGSIKWLES